MQRNIQDQCCCKTLCSLKVFKMKIDHLFLKIPIVFSSLFRVIWIISSKYLRISVMKDSLMWHCASLFSANLGGLIFKIFWHIAPNHGGASFATNPQRPSSCIHRWSSSEWTRIWMADNQSWCSSGFKSRAIVCLYILTNLWDNLESNVKLLADDTSIFSVVRDPIITSQKLNDDLDKS